MFELADSLSSYYISIIIKTFTISLYMFQNVEVCLATRVTKFMVHDMHSVSLGEKWIYNYKEY